LSIELDRVLHQEPTYTGQFGWVPKGFHRLERFGEAGHGGQTFRAVADAVLGWQVLSRAGLRLQTSSERVELGSTVLQRLGPMRAPCRIVEVFDEPRRAGFTYASLPGHPECGIEQFLVEHRPDDSVQVSVRSVSRGVSWYARLGGPASRLVQWLMVGRYLKAMRP
jgi:uncharacterized protein (UPF0548 family)